MTHMTKEEKAKAYDYALEILHKYDGAHIMFTQDLKEEMFPELKESKDKWIIKTLQEYVKNRNCMLNGPTQGEVLAWLEKQKYKERLDRMAPIYNDREKQKEQNSVRDIVSSDAIESCMLRYLQSAANRNDDIEIIEDTQKYKEELLEIIEKERKPTELCDAEIMEIRSEEYTKGFNDAMQIFSYKQEWSEFDKDILKDVITAVDLLGNDEAYKKEHPNLAKAFRNAKDWLKSLPERVSLQPKYEWSNEDLDFINMLILHFNYLINKGGDSVETYKSYIEKLKSLRPQPNTVSIIDATKFGNLEYERGVKDGIQSEKIRHWKPSEEQMEALEHFIRSWGESGTMNHQNTILCAAKSLYAELQKLLQPKKL